jgi:hypothetical protein
MTYLRLVYEMVALSRERRDSTGVELTEGSSCHLAKVGVTLPRSVDTLAHRSHSVSALLKLSFTLHHPATVDAACVLLLVGCI